MGESPFAIRQLHRFQVIAWIFHHIAHAAIPNLQVKHFFARAIHQMVGHASAGREARTISGSERVFLFTQNQRGRALEYIDELILPRMMV